MSEQFTLDDKFLQQALSQPRPPEEFRPVDLRLDRKEGLFIEWGDGRKSQFSLAMLRKNCPCATCRDERATPRPASMGRSLTILPAGIDKATSFADAHLVGNYALQITWGDGHNTGIYDFRLLRAMDAVQTA